jgi:tRNA(fMet)-specific endonuclease VapC
MRTLLDTNAYSALTKGRPEVSEAVRHAEELILSTIVLGELLFGFHNGSRYLENRRRLRSFLQEPRVRMVTPTPVTAEHFGEISAKLRKRGRPIPTNDVWIAAQAIETGSDLLSADAHFGEIDGLSWIGFSTP